MGLSFGNPPLQPHGNFPPLRNQQPENKRNDRPPRAEKPSGLPPSRDPFRQTERNEEARRIEALRNEIEILLKEEAARLRTVGFPVDDNCRIDPKQFTDSVVSRGFQATDNVKTRAAAAVSTVEVDDPNRIGALLEETALLLFNRVWFNQRLVMLRASATDDLRYGVDHLILDTESFQTIAAADSTIDPNYKSERLRDNIRTGKSVRYGVELNQHGVQKTSLEHLPYFIITITKENLLRLAEALTKKLPAAEYAAEEQRVLRQFTEQCALFGQMTPDIELKGSYRDASQIFAELQAAQAKAA